MKNGYNILRKLMKMIVNISKRNVQELRSFTDES